MQQFSFTDAFTGSAVTSSYPDLRSLVVESVSDLTACESVFFPGCSCINYALPLVDAVYNTLKQAQSVEGISLLCCGKILSFEENGEEKRADFERVLREHMLQVGVKRIVTACPNCTKALRALLEADERSAHIQVVPLPLELASLGYRVDAGVAREMLQREVPELGAEAVFSPHDSCPDRETGEFASGLRTLLENVNTAERKHNRAQSICCGSTPRAAGRMDAAERSAKLCGTESAQAGAQAMVCACMSCAQLLTALATNMPCFHYLELLYNWRIDWAANDGYMKLRFLFDDVLGAEVQGASNRVFVPLDVVATSTDCEN